MDMSDDLDKLAEFGVSKLHIECLRWYRRKRGKVIQDIAELQGKRIHSGKGGGRPIPPNNIVSKPHYLMSGGGARGGYLPADDDFVLSIRCTDDSNKHGYTNEVSFAEGRWTEISYNHNSSTSKNKRGKRKHEEYFELPSLIKCWKNKIPVGIIHKPKGGRKTKNKILGLGLITSTSREVSGVWNKKEGRRFLPLNYTIKPYDPNKLPKVDDVSLQVLYPNAAQQIEKKDYSSRGKRTTGRAREKTGYFKEQLEIQYDGKCAMCAFSSKGYMIGAHIVPFSKMNKWGRESKNAMNPADGLLLCRYCDVAFERGHITVDEKYRIIISQELEEKKRKNRPIKRWLDCMQKKIYVKPKSMHKPSRKYLKKKLELVGKTKPDKTDEVVDGVR